MRTLVIPDVHQQVDRLIAIYSHYHKTVDHTILLGDYFDSFTHRLEDVYAMCQWLNAAANNPAITLLLGNHDLHYLYPGFRCSGYKMETKDAIARRLSDEARAAIKIHAWIGNDILCSHAGLTAAWLRQLPKPMTLQTWLSRIEASFVRREYLWSDYNLTRKMVTSVGPHRGGYPTDIGGLLWCDWHHEFEPIPHIRQIVGHTMSPTPGVKGTNWNIDTGLQHVIVVTDGVVTIEPVAV